MADNIIEHVIRISGEQAEQTLENVANEAARTRAALDATSRLEILSARGGSDIERAALAYRKLTMEVNALKAAGGDARLATQVMERAQIELAAVVARTNAVVESQGQIVMTTAARTVAASTATTHAMDRVTTSAGSMKAGMFSLGQQVQDVGVMLVGGASPFTIIATQGPQIATAVQQMGGLGSALRAVGAAAVTAGPLLAAVAVAVAAAGTAYAVLGNAMTTAESDARQHNATLVAQASALSDTAAGVLKLRDAWRDIREEGERFQRRLDAINGALIGSEAAGAAARDKEIAAGRKRLQPLIDEVAQLQVALTAAETQAKDISGGVDAVVQAQAQEKAIRTRLALKRQELDAMKAEISANAEAAAQIAEYDAAVKESNAVLAAREKAAREAAAAAREHAQQEDALLKSLRGQDAAARGLAQAMLVLRFSRGDITEDQFQRESLMLRKEELEKVGKEAALAAEKSSAKAREDWKAIAASASEMSAEAIVTENAITRAVETMTGAATSGASLVQGGVSGLMQVVAQMGPIGQIVAAVVQIVANIDRFLDGVHEFVVSFAETIGDLPDILADSMQRSMQGFDLFGDAAEKFADRLEERLPDMIAGIIETIPRSIGMIVDLVLVRVPEIAVAFVTALLDVNLWKQVGEAFVQGVSESFGSLFTNIGNIGANDRGEGGLKSLFGGGSASSRSTSGHGSSSSRRSSGAPHMTTIFQGPILGLGVNGAEQIATEMTGRGFLRTPG